MAIKPSTINTHAAGDRPTTSILERIIVTGKLYQRPYRGPNYQAENQVLVALMQALASSPQTVLMRLVEHARQLCAAHSAGVSIAEGSGPHAVFRWQAVAGTFARFTGGTMPRWHSPCGTVLERAHSLLMRELELYYEFPASLQPPICEALLVPFVSGGRLVGTVWAVSYDDVKTFDREDLRLMESLAAFAGAAFHTISIARDPV